MTIDVINVQECAGYLSYLHLKLYVMVILVLIIFVGGGALLWKMLKEL